MAGIGTVEFFLKARDDATSTILKVTAGVNRLDQGLAKLASGAGLAGQFALAATAATAVTGALTAAGIAFGNTSEEILRASKATGVGAEELQVYRRIVRDAGGDTGALDTALIRFRRSVANSDPALKKLGITTSDTGEAFRQFNQILASSTNEKQRTKLLFDLMGRGAGELIPHMDDLVRKFGEVDAAMRTSNSLIDRETLAKGDALDDRVDQLTDSLTGLKNAFAELAIPIAMPIIDQFARLAREITDALGRLQEFNQRTDALDTIGDIAALGTIGGAARFRGRVLQRAAERDRPGPVQGPMTREEWVKQRERDLEALRAKSRETEDALDALAATKVEAKREKAIAALRDIIGGTTLEAARLQDRLDAIENTENLEKLVKLLREAGAVGFGQKALVDAFEPGPAPELRQVPRPRPEPIPFGPAVSEEEIDRLNDAMDGFIDRQRRSIELLVDLRVEWADTLERGSSALAFLSDLLSGLGASTEQFLTVLFQGVRNRTLTLVGAWKQAWDSMVNYAIAALARLLAHRFLNFVTKLLAGLIGGPVGGVIMDVVGGSARSQRAMQRLDAVQDTQTSTVFSLAGTVAPTRPTTSPEPRPAQQTTNVFHITGLDTHDIVTALEAPSGQLRRALGRQAMSGAY